MMRLKFFVIAIGVIISLVISCSPNPYAKTNKVYKKQVKTFTKMLREKPPANSLDNGEYWVGTTNFGVRKPNYVVIHHTAQNSCEQTLRTFTIASTQVSAHYVICKDGTIHHMLNDFLRAHHAGLATWGNNTDLNSSSIGIELDNNGFEYFDERQMTSLYRLLDTLKMSYKIPAANFIGHGDIAPSRKNDPNWRFPWKELYLRGFGTWYGDTTCVELPLGFNHITSLKLVGYNVKDSTAAINAFKRHWMQDTTTGMTPEAEKILSVLVNSQ